MLLIVFLIIGILIMFYLCFCNHIETFSDDTPPPCRKTTDCTKCVASSDICQWNENKKDCSSQFGDGYSSICPIQLEPTNSGIIYYRRKNKKRKEKRKN
jgi:hypothetical protein